MATQNPRPSRTVAAAMPALTEAFAENLDALQRVLAQPDDAHARRLAAVCADQVRDAALGLHLFLRGERVE